MGESPPISAKKAKPRWTLWSSPQRNGTTVNWTPYLCPLKGRLSKESTSPRPIKLTHVIGKFEKKGSYSVKTGYWRNLWALTKPIQGNTMGDSSKRDTSWTTIWNLKISPKVKIFTWKLAHDVIATEENLHYHHMPTSPRCVLCGFSSANTAHTIIYYLGVREIWKYVLVAPLKES